MAQGQAGGHTLFGDLKVDETKVDGVVPLSFDVVLYTEGGVLLGRQTVVNNSRYRFLNLQDGRYDVVVEVEGSEVARVRVLVQAAYKTDFRQDIHLEWKEGVAQRQRAIAPAVTNCCLKEHSDCSTNANTVKQLHCSTKSLLSTRRTFRHGPS
jgi:hypothetical protein